jgi:hypothetical protein
VAEEYLKLLLSYAAQQGVLPCVLNDMPHGSHKNALNDKRLDGALYISVERARKSGALEMGQRAPIHENQQIFHKLLFDLLSDVLAFHAVRAVNAAVPRSSTTVARRLMDLVYSPPSTPEVIVTVIKHATAGQSRPIPLTEADEIELTDAIWTEDQKDEDDSAWLHNPQQEDEVIEEICAAIFGDLVSETFSEVDGIQRARKMRRPRIQVAKLKKLASVGKTSSSSRASKGSKSAARSSK